MKVRLSISPNVRIIKKDDNALIYDCKTGKNLLVNKDALTVLELIGNGLNEEDIKSSYESPRLNELIDVLKEKLFVITEGGTVPEFGTGAVNPNYASGAMIQHLRLNITERCNLDCSYCYERESNVYGKKRVMTWEIAKKSIDEFMKLIKVHNQKTISIRFFGGEPLLNWELVKSCLEYATGLVPEGVRCEFILNTNGTLLNDEIAKTLSEYQVSIALSLDGTKEFHDENRKYADGRGSFDIVDKNIAYLTEHKCNFNLSVVCNDSNYPHLKELIDFLAEKQQQHNYWMRVNFNNIQICNREGIASLSNEKKVEYLLEAIKYAQEKGIYAYGGLTHFVFDKFASGFVGKHCGGVGSELSVDPAGAVFPCSGLDIEIGKLDSFMDIFTTEEYKGLVMRRAGSIAECHDCEIEGFCAGGCFAEVLSDSGKEKGAYRDCDLQRMVFKELVKEYVLSA